MPMGPGGGDMPPFANICFAAETAAATPDCRSDFEAWYWRMVELLRVREGSGRRHAGHLLRVMEVLVLGKIDLVPASAVRAESPDM